MHFFRLLSATAIWIALPVAVLAQPARVGPVFRLDTSSEYPEYPDIAVDPGGSFMVVWEEDERVMGRRFFATGTPREEPTLVSAEDHVNSGPGYEDGTTSVAADPGGNFVVSWTADPFGFDEPCEASYTGCLFSRRIGAEGETGPVWITHVPIGHDQVGNPEIAADGRGEFIVVWEGLDDDSEGVFARKLVNSAQTTGPSFQVNEQTEAYQGDEGAFELDAFDDGRFIIAWYDETQGAMARLYTETGNPITSEFLADAGGDGFDPAVAVESGGHAMVIWRSFEDWGVWGRVLDGDGSSVAGPFPIDTGYGPAIASGNDTFVVVWSNDDDQIEGQRFDRLGNALEPAFVVNPPPDDYVYREQLDVDMAANGDFVVVWTGGGGIQGQRFEVSPGAREIPLDGKLLRLSDRVPDDESKRQAKWVAKDANLEVPFRGSASDPRCNGEPPGTVKATIRIWSDTSGHDTGAIPLPCQLWEADGPDGAKGVEKRGYRYRDRDLVEGPCREVRLRGARRLTADCRGKGAAEFLYDLEPGTAEGTVHVALELGLFEYCTSFAPLPARDGSDGKRFQGANAPAPVACP